MVSITSEAHDATLLNRNDESIRRRACVHTIGCRLNQSETALMAQSLVQKGYDLVPFEGTADLAVINTCTVTSRADATCRHAIRHFLRRNPDAFVAVVGCYSELGYRHIASIKGVDLIIGTKEKLNVHHYVRSAKNARPIIIRDPISPDDFVIESLEQAKLRTRVHLKIQDGCNFICAFCVIPFARGRSRSRAFENLLEEARGLAQRGVKEVVLTGVNLGTYSSGNRTLVEVVDALNQLGGIERIRISSIEPTTVTLDILDRMSDPSHALVPYLHLPAQSGSNVTLKRMKRRYTRDEFLDFVGKAHLQIPDLCLGTDLMVGFPGEENFHFEETVDLFHRAGFAYAHVFPYSERQGTAAVRYRGRVPERVRKERCARLRLLSEAARHRFYQRFLDTTQSVLFEYGDEGYWTGHTANYIKVLVKSNLSLENAIRSVRLLCISGDCVEGVL